MIAATRLGSCPGWASTRHQAGLQGVVNTIRSALRLPYLAIERDGTVLASDGERSERVHPGRSPMTASQMAS